MEKTIFGIIKCLSLAIICKITNFQTTGYQTTPKSVMETFCAHAYFEIIMTITEDVTLVEKKLT